MLDLPESSEIKTLRKLPTASGETCSYVPDLLHDRVHVNASLVGKSHLPDVGMVFREEAVGHGC